MIFIIIIDITITIIINNNLPFAPSMPAPMALRALRCIIAYLSFKVMNRTIFCEQDMQDPSEMFNFPYTAPINLRLELVLLHIIASSVIIET